MLKVLFFCLLTSLGFSQVRFINMLTNIEEAAAVDSCAGGVDLITGNNTTMSGANDWTDYGICGAFDVNSTYPGKLYMLGNGSADGVFRAGIITPGRSYRVTLKARLVAGASTTIKAGNYSSDNPLNYMEFTPTSVETEYTDDFIGDGTNFVIGINTGFDGVAFTIDDVTLVECP